MRYILVFVVLICLLNAGLADGGSETKPTLLKPVVVTASRLAPGFPASSRVVNVLTRDDLQKLPVQSLQEALDYVPGVDIKSRNPFGVQGDVSIRGSTFSQVLILVDGVRVNNPQTAHHNLNLGVPLDQVDRIEVLQGSASSFYGADAVGGVINIITRRPVKNNLTVQGVRLENNTWSGAGTLSLKKDNFFVSSTVSQDSSSGYGEDTDYRIYNAGGRLGWRGPKISAGVSYNYLDKEFGAYDFYTPGLNFPSREWNRAHLLTGYGSVELGTWILMPRAYYRHHFDEFWLDQDRPEYYKNKSETDLYGGSISARGSLGRVGEVAVGFEYQEDDIDSTGLGDHSRNWISGFGEWGFEKGNKFFLNAGFRFDQYSDYELEFSPTVSLSFWPLEALNLRASAGRSFRVPSYTELYYNSPSNKGNPDLDPEHSWSVEVGADYSFEKNTTLHITFFYRDETDIIDWIKYPGDLFWQVINSGDVETLGLEASMEIYPFQWWNLVVGYDYLDKTIDKSGDYQSKYVLNYPRHQLKFHTILSMPYDCSLTFAARYVDRVGLDSYWLLDGRLAKKFHNFEIFLTAYNLSDESYEEIPGLEQPGRRAGIGIKTFFDF